MRKHWKSCLYSLICGRPLPVWDSTGYNLVLSYYKDLEVCINPDLSEWFWCLALAQGGRLNPHPRVQGKAGTEMHLQNNKFLGKCKLETATHTL